MTTLIIVFPFNREATSNLVLNSTCFAEKFALAFYNRFKLLIISKMKVDQRICCISEREITGLFCFGVRTLLLALILLFTSGEASGHAGHAEHD